jgi:hypothetical protein
MQKIFRCTGCQKGMRAVGSTGLGKEVAKTAICPYCKIENKLMWPRGDKFNIQRLATR